MPPRRRAREEGQRRPCRHRQQIDPREIGEHRRIVLGRQVGRVHLLVLPPALRERVHGVRRKRKPSAARPGPNATATPLGHRRCRTARPARTSESPTTCCRSRASTARDAASAAGSSPSAALHRIEDRSPAGMHRPRVHRAGVGPNSRPAKLSSRSASPIRAGTSPERCMAKPWSPIRQRISSAESGRVAANERSTAPARAARR